MIRTVTNLPHKGYVQGILCWLLGGMDQLNSTRLCPSSAAAQTGREGNTSAEASGGIFVPFGISFYYGRFTI